ncbi:MAG: LytR C-terminal domain-containing protein [Bacteroidota bacterium]|nr:LytR C-terminal domain-containing protein [Bacteroidota bacterium]
MKNSLLNYILNGALVLFLILVIYLAFSLINNSVKSGKDAKQITDTTKSVTNQPNLSIQLDVQNGTNENGAASRITEYLRKNGVDVVEMGNYKSKDIERTLVIDRVGDKNKSKKVAAVLGVNEKNIIEQMNNSLYLDVTVVIGKDYKDLKPFLEKKK